MKKTVLIILLIGLITISCSNNGNNVSIKKVNFVGNVDIKNKSKTENFSKNDKIEQGSIIEVKKDSQFDIVINDKDIIRIKPDSELKVQTINKNEIKIELLKGKVFCKLDGIKKDKTKFELKTPAAVCGVRGTQFAVSSSEEGDEVYTLKGKVSVAGKESGELILNEGEQTTVKPGRPPLAPQQILKTVKPFLSLEVAMMRPDLTIGTARTTVAVSDLSTIQRALEYYLAMKGKYPESLKELKIKNVDPWGTPLVYYREGKNSYVLFSAGPDKVLSTADDIQLQK